MALGAVTLLNIGPAGSSSAPQLVTMDNFRVTCNTVVGDTSYPSPGGTALSAAALGEMNVILFALVFISASSGSNNAATSATYNVSTNKLQCWANTDAAGCPTAEVANATNLSGLTFTIIAFGY